MKYILSLVLVLFSFSEIAHAEKYVLHANNDKNICGELLPKVNVSFGNDFNYSRIPFFNQIKWKKGSYVTDSENHEAEKETINILYSFFDINNDNKNELLIKKSVWFNSNVGDILLISNKINIDFSKKPYLSLSEVNNLNGFRPTQGWPYTKQGVGLASIFPFKKDNVSYIGINDVNLGNENLGDPDDNWRSLLIVKYIDEHFMYKLYNNEYKTSKLNVICEYKVKY